MIFTVTGGFMNLFHLNRYLDMDVAILVGDNLLKCPYIDSL